MLVLAIVTVTPGRTPPVASDTLPLIEPVVALTCAKAGAPPKNTLKTITPNLNIPPSSSGGVAESNSVRGARRWSISRGWTHPDLQVTRILGPTVRVRKRDSGVCPARGPPQPC